VSRISGRWWVAYILCFGAILVGILALRWIPELNEHQEAAKALRYVPTYEDANALPELSLGELLSRMRSTREMVRSYRMLVSIEYTIFDWETPLNRRNPSGKLISASEGEWIEKGPQYRVVQHRRIAFVSRPPKSPEDRLKSSDPKRESAARAALVEVGNPDLEVTVEPRDEWGVYDGSNRAWYTSTFDCIYLTADKFLSVDEKLNPVDLAPYPLEWGFERSHLKLLQENADNPAYTWSIIREEHAVGPRYRVRATVTTDGEAGPPRWEFEVDPNRDYLVTRWTTWKRGKVVRERTVSLQQAADNRWYAHRGEDRDLEGIRTVVFSEADFNLPLDDRLFNWENMPFNAYTVRLFKKTSAGTRTKMQFRNGRWEAKF